jgi:hypothetical protein
MPRDVKLLQQLSMLRSSASRDVAEQLNGDRPRGRYAAGRVAGMRQAAWLVCDRPPESGESVGWTEGAAFVHTTLSRRCSQH